MATPGTAANVDYGVSAGLDALSGVFGYLTSLENAQIARSNADMLRMEAEANAQRYEEQAQQQEAHEKVMYLASGVTLAGSPVDALATSARIAHENVQAILMGGESQAANAEVHGVNSSMEGEASLVSGFQRSLGMLAEMSKPK